MDLEGDPRGGFLLGFSHSYPQSSHRGAGPCRVCAHTQATLPAQLTPFLPSQNPRALQESSSTLPPLPSPPAEQAPGINTE